MKTNVKLLSAIALLASACTTGSMVTSSSYSDDVYFTPGDNPPVVVNSSPSSARQVKRPATITESRQEEAGKIVDNYQNKEGDLDSTNYVYNDSDTTFESDDEALYLINNYNNPEEISYTTRIRTFYNPYAYDPYWDTCYSPGWGFSWGMGYGAGFGYGYGGGYYDNWFNPYYGGWYYQGSAFGGYYGWGYPFMEAITVEDTMVADIMEAVTGVA